jgi:tight adherence protein C
MDPMTLIMCGCIFGAVMLIGFAFHPSTETTSISQRLEGLKAGQQGQRTQTSLRDQDEMNKSAFVRVILPLLDKFSSFFSQLTPVKSLDRAKVSIIQAGMQGKVTPLQIASLSYVMMIVVPLMSLSFSGIPTEIMSKPTFILVIGALLGYRLPFGFVQGKAKARQHEIRKALPFTLDLISISVEAGMALDGAMAIVMEKSSGPMAD